MWGGCNLMRRAGDCTTSFHGLEHTRPHTQEAQGYVEVGSLSIMYTPEL